MIKNLKFIAVIAISAIASAPLASASSYQFSDPGILTSSKMVKGTVYEKYSDGFTAEYTLKGYRKELWKDGYDLEATPGESDPDEWVRQILYGPPINNEPNSASEQSRLRQLIEVYLHNHQPAKALKFAERYSEIQKVLKTNGLPLAISDELLAEVKLQLGQKDEALKLLKSALSIAIKLNNISLKKEIATHLAAAKKQSANRNKIVFTSNLAHGSDADGDDDSSRQGLKNALSKLPGFPKITLHFSSYEGCTFQTEIRMGAKHYNGRILTIDGVATHGLAKREIIKLLEGSPGTSVSISFLNGDEQEQATLTREAPQKFGNPPYSKKTVLDLIDRFDYGCRQFASSGNSVNGSLAGFSDRNFDILVRAAVDCGLSDAKSTFGTDDFFIAHQAVDAMLALDSVGATEQANRLISLARRDTTFEPNRSYNKDLSNQLICALGNTGNFADAEYFCNEYLKESNNISDRSTIKPSPQQKSADLMQARQIYAELLVRKRDPRAKDELAKILNASRTSDRFRMYNNREELWLPEQLEDLGEYEKAQIWYSQALTQCQNQQKVYSNLPGIDAIRRQAYFAWHMADLQSKLKNNTAALATINAAITEYDKDQKPAQQIIVNQLGFFFPTRSDLVLKREAITANKALPPPPSGDERSFDTEFKLLKLCHQKIRSKDTNFSSCITELLRLYKERPPQFNFETPPLYMFSALLNIARDLADHGFFAESNRLLNELQTLATSKERTPTAALLPEIELALNADAQQQKSNLLWNQVERSLSPDDWSKTFPDLAQNPQMVQPLAVIGRLEANRQLANVYSKAGEQNRANKLIRRAVLNLNALKLTALAKREKALFDRFQIILLLDRAEISARNGKLQEATNEATEAIRLCSHTEPARTNGLNRAFNQTYRMKVTEIARIFGEQMNHKRDAIDLLKLANSTIKKGATAEIKLQSEISIYYEGFYALIDTYLAKLLFEENQYSEALPIIKEAVRFGTNNVPQSTYYLAGAIAEKCHSFEEAAHFYSQAAIDFESHFDNHIRKDSSKQILSRAINCCQKAPSMNKIEWGNIALRLGRLSEDSNPEEALKNYQFALTLISDDNPKKPNVLGRISYVKRLIEGKRALASSAPNTVHNRPIPASPTHSSPKTPEQMIAAVVRESNENLDTLKATAQLAERSHRSDEWQKWIELATAQAQVGKLDDAVKSAHLGIEKYKRTADTYYYDPKLLLPAGSIRCLPDALRRQGRSTDAKQLLDEAVAKVTVEHGSQSSDVARQLASEFSYWVENQNNEYGLKTLDQILALPPRLLELGGPYHSCSDAIYRKSDSIKNDRPEFARTILQRVIDSQLKQLGPDDSRLSTSRIKLAELAMALNDYPTAERELMESIRIRTQFVGMNAINEQANNLEKLLPKVGREADNVWIRDKNNTRWCPALLRKFGYEAEADSLEKTGDLPKSSINASYPSERQRLVGDVDWQREADEAVKKEPFSERTSNANVHIIHSSLASMDWNALAKASAVLVSIYEHSSDALAGRSYGCVPPSIYRIDYYIAAAKAASKLGKPAEAKRWIERAVKALPELSSWEWQQLARFEIELGDKVAAENYLDNSVSLLTDQYSAVGSDIPSMYKSIGKPEGAEKARAKLQELKEVYDQQMRDLNSQNDIFKNVQL